MRESNYIFPPQNRAVVSISQMLYDRRALDTSSPLALLNNLTSLTYLTSTSPRIREILTSDGGVERLLDILRESLLPRGYHTPADLWGLNGPPTARIISVDRGILLKHSLAFQCVVNIGVRGTEPVRTRVVQAGALDLVAQILESWLQEKGIFIFASPFGSKAAVESFLRGEGPPEVVEEAGRNAGTAEREYRDRRTRSGSTRHVQVQNVGNTGSSDLPTGQERITVQIPPPQGPNRSGISQFVSNLTRRNEAFDRFLGRTPRQPTQGEDEDVEMGDEQVAERPASAATDTREEADDADVETDGNSTSVEPDDSMDIDGGPTDTPLGEEAETGPSATPRASQLILPLSMTIPPPPTRSPDEVPQPQPAFPADAQPTIARTTSETNLAGPSNAGNRSPMAAPRPANVPIDTMSTQSSPFSSPTRPDAPESTLARRRDTITGRPANVNLAPPRPERRERDGANSEASDVDVDLQTATINANIRALQAQAAQAAQAQARTGLADTQDGQDADLVLAEDDDDEDRLVQEEALAMEQARLDMEAGAPPGQPGAAQTPRVPLQEPTPRIALLARPPPQGAQTPPEPAQIIIAAGAPRGFHDLGSYVGISSMLNPHGDCYSEDSILLSLQLLAYLSKYPHVRAAFHHPRRPMHPTFDLFASGTRLPERPAVSRTPNIFSLVERFTFKPVYGDRTMPKIPNEIQYWAGVIMRNACRKDDASGGVRQCANMSCGRWEQYAREFAKCRRCRKAKYCSKDCQSRAWSEGHRFWCNTRADQDMMEGERAANRGDGEGDDEDDEMDLPPPPRPTHREAGEARDTVRPLRQTANTGPNPAHARAETNPAAQPPPVQRPARTTTGRPPGWYTETVQREGWDFDTRLPDDRQQTLLAQLQRPRRDWQDPRQRPALAQADANPHGRARGQLDAERARNEELLEHQRLNHMLQQTTEAWRATGRQGTGRAMAAHAQAQQEAEASHAELQRMLRAARTNEERQMIMQRARDMLRTAAEAHARAGRNVESVVRQVLGEDVSAEQAEQAASPRQAGQTAQAGQSGAQGRRDRRSWFGGLGIGSQQQQQQQNGEGQGGRPGEGATRRP